MNRRDFLQTSTMAMLAGSSLLGSLSAAEQGVNMQYVTLNNGNKMPLLGLGTYSLRGKEGVNAMVSAIKIGYRLIDTAQMYGNEREVGQAIKESGVARSEFFITTKLSSDMNLEQTRASINESLKVMGLDYVDLLLLHRPYNQAVDMYKAMEEFYKQGKIKALGISNFRENVYLDFIKKCEIAPAVNQMETHVFLQQTKLQATMKNQGGCILESWSPFVSGKQDVFNNEKLVKIAKKHNKTVAQVILRWLTQRNIVTIPRTTKTHRMQENISIFDFTLDSNDIAEIATLDTNESSFGWW